MSLRTAFTLLALGLLLGGCLGRHDSFPKVERSKLLISLQRTACFGSCPDYTVTISGDGHVIFATKADPAPGAGEVHREFSDPGIAIPGRYVTKIDASKVDELVEKFRDARFFDLKSKYIASITDNPTYIISISTGHGSKRVVDYVGRKAGMPRVVSDLEDAIDIAAGTRRWIDGTADAIPALVEAKADFTGRVGFALVGKAVERGDTTTLERLRKLEAPITDAHLNGAAALDKLAVVDWMLAHGVAATDAAVQAAFEESIRSDSTAVFDRLVTDRRIKPPSSERATQLLGSVAASGNVRLTTYLLALNPEVDFADIAHGGKPALFDAAKADCPADGSKPRCDLREVVRLLLAAGANPRWSNPDFPESVLFLADDRETARMLLAAGADPNFHDSDGEPIIFSVYGEGAALAMMEAGLRTDVRRPADGMTVRRWAEYQKWPNFLARLDRAAK